MKLQEVIKKYLQTLSLEELKQVSLKTGFSIKQLEQYATDQSQWPTGKVARFQNVLSIKCWKVKYILKNTKKGTTVDAWSIDGLKKHTRLSQQKLLEGFDGKRFTGYQFVQEKYPVYALKERI